MRNEELGMRNFWTGLKPRLLFRSIENACAGFRMGVVIGGGL